LQGLQTEIATDTQKANVLQAAIKALQGKIAEVQQTLGSYNPDPLMQQLSEAKTVIAQKIGIAGATLKEKTTQIDQKISLFDAALGAQETAEKQAFKDSGRGIQTFRDLV
jgi:hypothetical protein